ncbi:MAG TPA: hypothetical protein DEA43_01020 [Candidatus Moranbacteria bacterium]|nr:hypothetical protein [Candidatus Moranbacteria bacterium]HBI34469.1 hypothetical protein [Candidatus Moranbacteria bacterium]HBT45451.1 hypothetical protein [Candidatus Moranbacteria bacterium]
MADNIEIEKLEQYKGKQVKVRGIVEKIEDHGGILFLEISHSSSLAKAIIIPDRENVFLVAKNIKKGYIVEMVGFVKECPLSNGHALCEVDVEMLSIISARTRLENMIKIAREN